MELFAGTELLLEAVDVVYGECDGHTGRRIVAEAIERVRRAAEEPDARSVCCFASDCDVLLWQELLRGLAGEAPDLFGRLLPELGEHPRGDALAYLYVITQSGSRASASGDPLRGLAPFRAPRAERDLITRAREALAERIGANWGAGHGPAPDFAREPTVWVVGDDCPLLNRFMEHRSLYGLSLCPHEAVRGVVLLTRRGITDARKGRRAGGVAGLLLHESIHGVLAAAADACPEAWDPLLAHYIDEAVVELLALGALHLLAPAHPDWDALRAAISGQAPTVALLDLLTAIGGAVTTTGLNRAAELAISNLCAVGAIEVAQNLARWSSDELLLNPLDTISFMEHSQQHRVVFGDAVRATYRGSRLHAFNGEASCHDPRNGTSIWHWDDKVSRINGDQPAVISPETIEWWNLGFRHRDPDRGPALVVAPGATVQVQPKPNARPLELAGPAVAYFTAGQLTRAGGPALIETELDGSVRRTEFWRNGHRLRRAPAARRLAAATATCALEKG